MYNVQSWYTTAASVWAEIHKTRSLLLRRIQSCSAIIYRYIIYKEAITQWQLVLVHWDNSSRNNRQDDVQCLRCQMLLALFSGHSEFYKLSRSLKGRLRHLLQSRAAFVPRKKWGGYEALAFLPLWAKKFGAQLKRVVWSGIIRRRVWFYCNEWWILMRQILRIS